MTAVGPGARPDLAELLDWLEGRLDPESAAGCARAVAENPTTAAAADWLRQLLDARRSMPLHAAPALVRQKLSRHFAKWSTARAAMVGTQSTSIASLLFDSRQDMALVEVRAADDGGATVHLAYCSEQADIVLDIYRAGAGKVRVDGQVLVNDSSQAPVFEAVISGSEGSHRTVDGDPLGRFRFAEVPETSTTLTVTNGEMVVVADLDLRAQGGSA